MNNEIIPFLSDNFPIILSTVNTIAGYLFTVIFLRKNTSTQEFEKIKAGHFNEAINELLKNGKMTYTEYYKAKNFLDIAKKADEYYSKCNDGTTTKERLDFDWFIRLYETVGNISDEKIQDIWARILAGEINKPGTFSIKTIEVLKCIGKSQAELFEKFCAFAFRRSDSFFIPKNDDYLKFADISYSDLMQLDELGLINCYGFTSINVCLTKDNNVLFFTNTEVVLARSKSDNYDLSINVYPFTRVGCELYRILDISTNTNCLYKFLNEMSINDSYQIEIHKIVNLKGDVIEFKNRNLLDEEL